MFQAKLDETGLSMSAIVEQGGARLKINDDGEGLFTIGNARFPIDGASLKSIGAGVKILKIDATIDNGRVYLTPGVYIRLGEKLSFSAGTKFELPTPNEFFRNSSGMVGGAFRSIGERHKLNSCVTSVRLRRV